MLHRGILTPFYGSTPLGITPFFTYKDDMKELMLVYNELLLEKMYKFKQGFFDPKKDNVFSNSLYTLWQDSRPPPGYDNYEAYLEHAGNVEHMRRSPLLKQLWFYKFINQVLYETGIDRVLFGYPFNACYMQMQRLLFDAPHVAAEDTHDWLAREFTNNPTNPHMMKNYQAWLEKERNLAATMLQCHICASVATRKCIHCWNPQFLCGAQACQRDHKCT